MLTSHLPAARLGLACLATALPIWLLGCSGDGETPLRIAPRGSGTAVTISAPIGDMRLWIPEAIMTERGASAVYPQVPDWRRRGSTLLHSGGGDTAFGPGNCKRVDADTIDCLGVQLPVESAVRWETSVEATERGVEFELALTNAGERPLRKAGASVCLSFLGAKWWNDHRVYVSSDGRVRTLADLGRDAGHPGNVLQAYLFAGRVFENEFYRRIWGVNRHRVDRPVMVSHHPAGWRIGIESDRAYFLLSSTLNPCTDIMLVFGDLSPGATRSASGRVWVDRGDPRAFFGAGPR